MALNLLNGSLNGRSGIAQKKKCAHPVEVRLLSQGAIQSRGDENGRDSDDVLRGSSIPKPTAPREFDEMTVDGVCIENMDQPTPVERQFFCDGARWQFDQDRTAYESMEQKYLDMRDGHEHVLHKIEAERKIDHAAYEALEKDWERLNIKCGDYSLENEALEKELKEARALLGMVHTCDSCGYSHMKHEAVILDERAHEIQMQRDEAMAKSVKLVEALNWAKQATSKDSVVGKIVRRALDSPTEPEKCVLHWPNRQAGCKACADFYPTSNSPGDSKK